MKALNVAVVVVVAVGVAVAVAMTASKPDLDAIIASKDCDQVMALTDADVAGATAKQQTDLTLLIGGCALEQPMQALLDALK